MPNLQVTLYVRVWIETFLMQREFLTTPVTLYVRVWIETWLLLFKLVKFVVTLYVRVWIETLLRHSLHHNKVSHPLREGVD